MGQLTTKEVKRETFFGLPPSVNAADCSQVADLTLWDLTAMLLGLLAVGW